MPGEPSYFLLFHLKRSSSIVLRKSTTGIDLSAPLEHRGQRGQRGGRLHEDRARRQRVSTRRAAPTRNCTRARMGRVSASCFLQSSPCSTFLATPQRQPRARRGIRPVNGREECCFSSKRVKRSIWSRTRRHRLTVPPRLPLGMWTQVFGPRRRHGRRARAWHSASGRHRRAAHRTARGNRPPAPTLALRSRPATPLQQVSPDATTGP
jgi:hypothetical protein